MFKDRQKGLLLVSTGALMWGGSGVAGQYLLQNCGFETTSLVVSRMVIAGLMLLIMDLLAHKQSILRILKDKESVLSLILFSIFGMLAVQFTYFSSINYGNAAATTVIQYLTPIIIITYNAIRLHKAPKRLEIFCVFLAVTGTFLLVTHGHLSQLVIPFKSLVFALLSAVAAAYYTVKPKNLIIKWGPLLIIGWSMLIGGILLGLLGGVTGISGNFTPFNTIIYIYIIIFGTVVAFGCYLSSVKYLEPQETSMFGSLEPLAAIVISCIFLNLHFGLLDLLGSVMIISTIFLLSIRKKR